MSRNEKENWKMNIEACADHIAEVIGYETVSFVFGKYGADSVEELSPNDYADVFSELYAIEADLEN